MSFFLATNNSPDHLRVHRIPLQTTKYHKISDTSLCWHVLFLYFLQNSSSIHQQVFPIIQYQFLACSFEWNMEIRSSIYFETPSSLAFWHLATYISMNEIQVFRANNKDKNIFKIIPQAYLIRMKTIYTGQKIKFLKI